MKQQKDTDIYHLTSVIHECARKIYEHESEIINMIFEEGGIEGISKEEMKYFVMQRINLCLDNLGLDPLYSMSTMGLSSWGTISKWFYKGINNYQMVDFFTGGGREYVRDWNSTKFVWN